MGIATVPVNSQQAVHASSLCSPHLVIAQPNLQVLWFHGDLRDVHAAVLQSLEATELGVTVMPSVVQDSVGVKYKCNVQARKGVRDCQTLSYYEV